MKVLGMPVRGFCRRKPAALVMLSRVSFLTLALNWMVISFVR